MTFPKVMTIPFNDLKAHYFSNKKEIDKAISSVLSSARFIGGAEVFAFEEEYRKYLGAQACIAVNSGTDALILGIRSLGLTPGSEIIIPANTFYSTALAVVENGLRPVFVDTDPIDNGISLSDLKKKLNCRTKAVIAVHMYGQADKIGEITNVIRRKNDKIFLIEDACQAHGAEYEKTRVGNFGVLAAFSFYPGKNLGAAGDGGAIVTNDSRIAAKCRLLHEYGQKEKYHHVTIGVNSRLDTIQAAVLRVKLRHLDEWNRSRQRHAGYYRRLLGKLSPGIRIPEVFDIRKSVYHIFAIRLKKRDELKQFLAQSGVETNIHYPVPLHLQKAFHYLGYRLGDLPETEKAAQELLSLPMYPEMKKKQIDYIVDKVVKFMENGTNQ